MGEPSTGPPDPRLRLAVDEDYDAIRTIHREAVRRLAAGHYGPEQIDAWSGWVDEETFRRWLAEGRLFLLAEADGAPRGYGTLDPRNRRVRAVYVDPGAARRGIGSALLDALEGAAREAGLPSIHLEASMNAVPFYLARGWRAVEAGRHATLAGVELECVLMEKHLAVEGR